MHDRDGKPLQVGDRVMVPCWIKETYVTSGGEYCNLQLMTEESMFPSDTKTCMMLNAKQVVKSHR